MKMGVELLTERDWAAYDVLARVVAAPGILEERIADLEAGLLEICSLADVDPQNEMAQVFRWAAESALGYTVSRKKRES